MSQNMAGSYTWKQAQTHMLRRVLVSSGIELLPSLMVCWIIENPLVTLMS